MKQRTSTMLVVAVVASALAAAAPATAAPRGSGGGGPHMSAGGGARMAVGGGGRSFNGGAGTMGAMSYQGAGRSANFTAKSGSNYAAYRSGWRGRGHRGFGFGAGFAAGALIGSGAYYYGGYPYGYYDDYAYDDSAYGDDGYDANGSYAAAPEVSVDASSCGQRFRSYDPASGTYLGYDGLRHPCP